MKLFTDYLFSLGLPSSQAEEYTEKLRIYRDFLMEQNKLFNLTAITDPEEIVIKHFIDSLAAVPYIHGSVADIGTGAGFPGLPLAVLKPQYFFTLIDSLQKRVSFLDELVQKLSLQNVQTLHSRAEDLPKTKKYTHVVSRAVAQLNTLCEYCLPFVEIGGSFLAYKAADCEQEVHTAQKAVHILGGKVEEVKEVPLFHSDIVRKLIIIRKVEDTPLKYPRSGNKPKKQPL